MCCGIVVGKLVLVDVYSIKTFVVHLSVCWFALHELCTMFSSYLWYRNLYCGLFPYMYLQKLILHDMKVPVPVGTVHSSYYLHPYN